MMDATTINAATAGLAALGALMARGGWTYLKDRRDTSASVQTAQIDDDAKMRAELWAAIAKMQERQDKLQAELDESRREHINLLGEHALLKAEHAALLVRYAALEQRMNSTPS